MWLTLTRTPYAVSSTAMSRQLTTALVPRTTALSARAHVQQRAPAGQTLT